MTLPRTVAEVLAEHVVFEVECIDRIPVVSFARGQRKDDVMHERLACFTAGEGVVFIGRAQEKNKVFRTESRRDRQGKNQPRRKTAGDGARPGPAGRRCPRT
jgi:hypothetical protein